MLFNIRKPSWYCPEIGDKFTVLNGEKKYVLTVEKAIDDHCSKCAFDNLCKDSEFNKSGFPCCSVDRPDGENVIFVLE